MRPLFTDAPTMAPGQPLQAQMPGSALAAALMRSPGQQPNLNASSFSLPPGTMDAMRQMLKKPDGPQYGNPNGEPSMGAAASPALLSDQMSSNMQIGQPGAPIMGQMPQSSYNDSSTFMDQIKRFLEQQRLNSGAQGGGAGGMGGLAQLFSGMGSMGGGGMGGGAAAAGGAGFSGMYGGGG